MKRIRLEEQEVKPPEQIEKVVHFVWAGGDELMPTFKLQNTINWARNNSDFKILLWVDAWNEERKEVDLTKLEYIVTQYRMLFKELGGHNPPFVFFNELPPDYKPQGVAPVLIRDITQHGMVNEAIRFEIDMVQPNYGASSDQLRYRILYNHGSGYFDADVSPGKDSLGRCPFFNEPPKEHILYLDHMTQRVNPIPEAFEIFEMFDVIQGEAGHVQPIPGNDSFICTKYNPLMKKIMDMTADNYRLRELGRIDDMIMTAYSSHYWKDLTLERTGTEVIRKALESSNPQGRSTYYQLRCNETPVQVFPLRHHGLMLAQPLKNTKEWLKGIRLDKTDISTSFLKLIEQIKQEIRFFGVLRLDDHLYFLEKLALTNSIQPVELQNQFCRRLVESGLSFKDINVAQWVSTNPLVESFYRQHQLLNCTQVLKGSDKARFNTVCELATSKSLLERLKILAPQNISQLNYRTGEVEMIHHALQTAVNFIALLQSEPDRFERFSSSESVDILNNVKMIAKNFQEVFQEQNLIFDFKIIDALLEKFQNNAIKDDKQDASDFLSLLLSAQPDEKSPPSPKSEPMVTPSWTKRHKEEPKGDEPKNMNLRI